MKSHKLLVFDVYSEYGHFRKFNTTSSPLTYAIPTRTALAGILGAVLGVERETAPGIYPDGVIPVNELFSPDQAEFAVQLLSPVKKVNIAFNLLDTGKSASSYFNITNRTQIEFELLKNPRFRIFFNHQDQELLERISGRIKSKTHHFTPYLGLSQFTATLDWVGEETAQWQEEKEGYHEIHTAVNLSKINAENPVKFGDAFYSTDTMPMSMSRDRKVSKYSEVLVERSGKTVAVRTDGFWKTSCGNILFL